MGATGFGVGLAGTLDQILLHQILHWHHFYDRSTAAAGLVSDGLLHFASTLLLLLGGAIIFREWSTSRRVAPGILIGLGGFNLYDGTVQHKILRLHQIRYGVDSLPYDVVFIGVATATFVAGLILWRRGEAHR